MEALYLLSYGSKKVAPKVGLEPTTIALTVRCSTTELLRKIFKKPSDVLLSQGEIPQLPSALKSLTSVFGMGTGVTSLPLSLDFFECLFTQNWINGSLKTIQVHFG